jgi:hypothetical protein
MAYTLWKGGVYNSWSVGRVINGRPRKQKNNKETKPFLVASKFQNLLFGGGIIIIYFNKQFKMLERGWLRLFRAKNSKIQRSA